jgi:hypothetical protein
MNPRLFIKIIFLLSILLPHFIIKAQEKGKDLQVLTGNLVYDSKIAANNYYYIEPKLMEIPQKKSQYIGGLFSLILPGAGEFYAQSYLKAAIFLVVEAAAISTALIYNHKGDYQTAFFQGYANSNWSVIRYAEWTIKNIKNINPIVDPSQYSDVLLKDKNGNDIGVNWGRLNELESALGGGYSHQLPTYGTQGYYELIGKYDQYSHGWSTSNQGDTDFHILPDQFLWYAHQRGVANEYYKTGSFGVGLIYLNHALSALDAIWTTDKYNDSIAMNVRLNGIQMADHMELIPTLNLSFSF